MAQKQMSRLEANKEVRRILVRHGIDTGKLQFSCNARSLSLSGELYKEGGKDLDLVTMEALLKDFSRLGLRITSELSNWTISDGSITRKGKHKTIEAAGNYETQKRVILEKNVVDTMFYFELPKTGTDE